MCKVFPQCVETNNFNELEYIFYSTIKLKMILCPEALPNLSTSSEAFLKVLPLDGGRDYYNTFTSGSQISEECQCKAIISLITEFQTS